MVLVLSTIVEWCVQFCLLGLLWARLCSLNMAFEWLHLNSFEFIALPIGWLFAIDVCSWLHIHWKFSQGIGALLSFVCRQDFMTCTSIWNLERGLLALNCCSCMLCFCVFCFGLFCFRFVLCVFCFRVVLCVGRPSCFDRVANFECLEHPRKVPKPGLCLACYFALASSCSCFELGTFLFGSFDSPGGFVWSSGQEFSLFFFSIFISLGHLHWDSIPFWVLYSTERPAFFLLNWILL